MKAVSQKVINILASLVLLIMCGIVAAFTCSATAIGVALVMLDMFLLGVLAAIYVESPQENSAK